MVVCGACAWGVPGTAGGCRLLQHCFAASRADDACLGLVLGAKIPGGRQAGRQAVCLAAASSRVFRRRGRRGSVSVRHMPWGARSCVVCALLCGCARLSEQRWVGGGGVGGAELACQSEAPKQRCWRSEACAHAWC